MYSTGAATPLSFVNRSPVVEKGCQNTNEREDSVRSISNLLPFEANMAENTLSKEIEDRAGNVFSRTMGTLGSCLGWAGNKVFNIAKAAPPNVVSWMLKASNKHLRQEMITLVAELDEITGSRHASHALLQISPKITSTVLQVLNGWPVIAWLASKGDIHSIIEATLFQVAINLIKYERINPLAEDDQAANPIAKMIAQIINTLNAEIPLIDQTLSAIHAYLPNCTSTTKVENYQATLRPLLQKIVAMALPNGHNDIKASYPLNRVIWAGIQYVFFDARCGEFRIDSLIPLQNVAALFDLACDAFMELKRPLSSKDECKERLRVQPGGEELLSLVNKLTTQVFPSNIGKGLSVSNVFLAERFFSLLIGSNSEKSYPRLWLEKWFAAQIQNYSGLNGEGVLRFHKIVGSYLEGVIYQIIVKISEEREETEDLSTFLLARIIASLSQSIHANYERINSLLDEIKDLEQLRNKSASNSVLVDVKKKELARIFKPLSLEFLSTIGILSPEDIPLPHILQKEVFQALISIAPNIFLELYTNARMYLGVVKPKSLRKEEGRTLKGQLQLESLVNQFWQFHSPLIKEVVASTKNEIADVLVEQIEGLIPNCSFTEADRRILANIIEQGTLTQDEDLNRAILFFTSQLHEVFLRIVSHLALTYPVLQDYNKTHQPKDVISNALLHILCMGGFHLREVESGFRVKFAELESLKLILSQSGDPEERNRIKQSISLKDNEVRSLFIPFATEVMISSGLEDIPAASIVKEKILPAIFSHIYVGILIEQPFSKEMQDRVALMNNGENIEKISQQIALALGSSLKKVFLNSTRAIDWINKNLFGGLDEGSVFLLENVWTTVGENESAPIPQAWSFIQEYCAKIINRVFVHLSLHNRSATLDTSETILSSGISNGLRLLSCEIEREENGSDLDERVYSMLNIYREMHEGDEKKDFYKEILRNFSRLTDTLLQAAGFESEKALCIPHFLQKPIWILLKKRLMPELLLTIYQDLSLHTQRNLAAASMDGHDALEEAIDDLCMQFVPSAITLLNSNNADSTELVEDLLEEVGIDAINTHGIQEIICKLSHSVNDPSAARAWEFISNAISGKVFDAATHLAVGKGQNSSNNILTNIVHNSLNVLLPLYRNVAAANGSVTEDLEKFSEFLFPSNSNNNEISNFSTQLKDACSVLSHDIVRFIREYFVAHPGNIKVFFPSEYSGSDALVIETVGDVCTSSNESALLAFHLAAKFMESITVKVLLQLATTTEPIYGPVSAEIAALTLPASLMVRMISLLAKHGTSIRVRLTELKGSRLSEAELAQRKQDFFIPLSQELLEMALPNQENDLPLPVIFRKLAFTILKTSIFPKILGKMHHDIWGWDDEAAVAKSRLQDQFQSTHANEFLHVISRLGTDKVDQYLRSQSCDMADVLLDKAKKYFLTSSEQGGRVAATLGQNHMAMHMFFSENIRKGFSANDPSIEQMWSVVHTYIENLTVRMSANVFGHISNLEGGKSDYLIKTTLSILDLCIKHFGRVQEIVNDKEALHAFDVHPQEMLVHYNHSVDPRLKSSQEYKDARSALYQAEEALRQANYQANRQIKVDEVKKARITLEDIRAKELVSTLLMDFFEMAGFNSPEDFPFPEPFKDILWRFCHETLVPRVTDAFFTFMTEPSTINTFAETFIGIINDILNSLPDSDPLDHDNDETQKRLNEACGILVRQFVDLMPKDITGKVLHIDRIKNLAARTVGKVVREELSKWTIIKLIDLMMYTSLPTLLPGEWVGHEEEERFSPRTVVDGVMTGEPAPLRFILPITPQERKRADDTAHKQSRLGEAQLRRLISQTLDEQVRGVLRNFILSYWSKFQNKLDGFFEGYANNHGEVLKKGLDYLFRKIFFDFIGGVVSLIAYPVYVAVCYFVEFYYNKKAKDIIQNLHLDINGDFMRKLSLEIMHNINMHRKELRV